MFKAWKELLAVYAVIFAAVGALMLTKAYAQWEEDGYVHPPTAHERYHHYYQKWEQPVAPNEYGKIPKCCNAAEYTIEGRHHVRGDCEPTRAEIRDGEWWAELPPYSKFPQRWIKVPEHKIIRERNPSSEEGHLCWVSPGFSKPPEEGVLCFVPPDLGG